MRRMLLQRRLSVSLDTLVEVPEVGSFTTSHFVLR